MRHYFIIGGQKVFYYEKCINRLFNSKSIKGYQPKYPEEEKCIDIFNDFLIEVVLLYGFLGGYAVHEVLQKQKISQEAKEQQKKIYATVEENKEKSECVFQRIQDLQVTIQKNQELIQQLREAQEKNQELEQKIMVFQQGQK
ncbi:hypothetical protein PPERSA_07018 [Pseudocohnilembus persalinus]|uniref:Optic atrophy 3-like protein n=1 Tax=Pseudocohnilembus persalinus TaxID=266149 RepID=A0A0V0QLV7_PSEPJ|nr:hypothetical protein PPERSA_07018 [Pseudocohnilembus persalinus]|eukprot:KRX03190.1 hypothetical protein PPERSA_07018 [Pseudocohnilembus persalinus]